MKTKFKVSDILHENGTDFYYLIEELKPHLAGTYYVWRELSTGNTGHWEAILIDNYSIPDLFTVVA